ncbi:39477_t:CDS:2, partial [Gigaspora margarita]
MLYPEKQIYRRKEVAIGTNAILELKNLDNNEKKEHKAFSHFKKLEKTETVNKVNIPEVYQKEEVMPERSLYRNGNEIVSVVEERFQYDSSRVEKELRSGAQKENKLNCMTGFERLEKNKVINNDARNCKNRAKKPDKENRKKENKCKRCTKDSEKFEVKKLVETDNKITYGKDWETWIEKIIGIIKERGKCCNQKEVETDRMRRSIITQVWIIKIRKFQETVIQNRERVEEPTKETFDGIYEAECRMDYANGIKDSEDGRTRIK